MSRPTLELVKRSDQDYLRSIIRNEIDASMGSGSGGGDDMNARISRIESDVRHIESDIKEVKSDIRTLINKGFNMFLITWTGIITSALGLAWLIAMSADWL